MSTTTGIPPRNWIQEAFILLVPALLIPAFFMLVRQSQSEPNPYTYKKLGLKGGSHLEDEEAAKYDGSNSKNWKVKALLCHPIKSCRGIELDTAKIDGSGILWDRKFVVAEWTEPKAPTAKAGQPQKAQWVFRTLRAPGYENLAKVKTDIWLRKGSDTEGLLIVRYPRIPAGLLAPLVTLLMALRLLPATTFFQLPLEVPEKHDYPKQQVKIFDDNPVWLNYQKHVPKSLQSLVKAKNRVTLFRVDPAAHREVLENAPKPDEVGYQPIVGAADSHPLSVQNLASVRAVGKELAKDIPHFIIRRLRPNIVVAGGKKFDEDDWQRIRIGEHEIYCSCHTTRCKLPCVDPETAIRHPSQPEQYLRKNRNVDPGAPNKGCLGLQMIPATDGLIEIKVGDAVEVLERGQHHFIS